MSDYGLLDRCDNCRIPHVELGESGSSYFLGFISTNVIWSRILCANCGAESCLKNCVHGHNF